MASMIQHIPGMCNQMWILETLRPGQELNLFLMMLGLFLSHFFDGMAAHIVPLNKLPLGCAGVMVGVIDSQEGLRGWFVSLGIHMNVKVQGFPAEYRTVA